MKGDKQVIQHLNKVLTNELTANEPESAAIAKAFAWAERFATDAATVELAESFYRRLSPLALEMQVGR